LITIQREGPPGVVGEVTVTGMQHHTSGDIIRFLDLRAGSKITAERLAQARQKLRDCGRFWDFEITPEYIGVDAVSSRRVNLRIAVKEQKGVPLLNEPLSPVQEAMLRLCAWVEQFPARDEEIQVTVTNRGEIPLVVEFILSPKRGLLLNGNLEGAASVSAGFLLTQDTVQLCAWASSNQLSAPRAGGGGSFFMHLLPNKDDSGNHFNFSVGAGFSSDKHPATPGAQPALKFDVQLSRAAFLDLLTREDMSCSIESGTLTMTSGAFTLRADAATGRIFQVGAGTNQTPVNIRFGDHVWEAARRDFSRRSESLTNRYAAGHGLSSFAAFVAAEAVRWRFTDRLTPGVGAEQRARALAAVRKLLNTDMLLPVDRLMSGSETNVFFVPLDEVDKAMATNSMAAFFSGLVFEYGGELFPKYSWPWTAAREMAFVLISQGRYTDAELDRLYRSEDTGPIGFLVLAHLLSAAGSPASKNFASQGIARLDTKYFLRDCNLFLRGESSFARSFARTAEVLRNLPEDEFAALIAVLPEAEANLLRESGAALRANPQAEPAGVLEPAIGKYWEESLRAKVRGSLRQLLGIPKEPGTAKTVAPLQLMELGDSGPARSGRRAVPAELVLSEEAARQPGR